MTQNGLGITMVRCPHLKTCRFGEKQSKKARARCRGVFCEVNHWESRLVIGFKCQWFRKWILVEVNGNEIRHIPRNSSDYQDLMPRLKPMSCAVCQHPALDYHVVYGEAIIDLKCRRDGLFSSHLIK